MKVTASIQLQAEHEEKGFPPSRKGVSALPPGKSFPPSPSALLLALTALEGACALVLSLRSPSEAGSALLFGLSPSRLLVGGVMLALVVGLAVHGRIELSQPGRAGGLERLWSALKEKPVLIDPLPGGVIFRRAGIFRRVSAHSQPGGRRAFAFHGVVSQGRRARRVAGPVPGPGRCRPRLCCGEKGDCAWGRPGAAILLFSPRRYTALRCGFSSRHLGYALPRAGDDHLPACACAARVGGGAALAARLGGAGADRPGDAAGFHRRGRLHRLLAYRAVGPLRVYPYSATWHLVARSFLEGKLYLENPASTHDLTFYNGHWYVPFPRCRRWSCCRCCRSWRGQHQHGPVFHFLGGALNAVMVYPILSSASRLKMIPTSTAGNLWLTVLFAWDHPLVAVGVWDLLVSEPAPDLIFRQPGGCSGAEKGVSLADRAEPGRGDLIPSQCFYPLAASGRDCAAAKPAWRHSFHLTAWQGWKAAAGGRYRPPCRWGCVCRAALLQLSAIP